MDRLTPFTTRPAVVLVEPLRADPPRRFPFHSLLRPLRDLTTPPAGQVPALDALRVCAILAVLACHTAKAVARAGLPADPFARFGPIRAGWLGVDLFFVLSGFLIGRQLWREYADTGTVRLGRFAVRRGLRIWPLYFATLTVAVVGFGWNGRWWVDAMFLSNYLPGGLIPGGWSLSTEEHFYLIAPVVLIVGGIARGPAHWFRIPLLVTLLALPVVRALTGAGVLTGLSGFAAPFDRVYRPIHTHADGLLIGFLLANLMAAGVPNHRRGASGWALGLAAVAFVGSWAVWRDVLLFSGAAVFFGGFMWFLLARPIACQRLFARWPVFALSRLSYGMYLNHLFLLPFVLPLAFLGPLGSFTGAAAFGLLVAVSAGCAVLTYCLIEAPFLRLRERLAASRPSARNPAEVHPCCRPDPTHPTTAAIAPIPLASAAAAPDATCYSSGTA